MAEDTVPLFDDEESVPLGPYEKSWVGSVCAYFRDFLDTDFQRTRAPKRSINSRDGNSNLTGVALSKYPDLGSDIWKMLSEPLDQSLSLDLTVRRNKYRSRLSKGLNDVIVRQIDNFKGETAYDIASQLKAHVRQIKPRFADDPERFADNTLQHLRSSLLNTIVNPLLVNLDTFFQGEGNESLEKIFDIEEELGAQLVESVREAVSPAVAQALVDNDFTELDELIDDATEADAIKANFLDYFQGFATNDFFNELSELRSTIRLKDNFQIYIYVGALRYGSSSYPLFYFPIDISLDNSIFRVEAAPHLLINKKAIDFAVSEVARETGHAIAFNIPERIVYVREGESFLTHIQAAMDEFTTALSLKGALDLHEARPQTIARSQIRVDNSLYFAAFDTADESLLNDYEDLLTKLGEDTPESEDFQQLINNFMESDPVSYESIVDEEWRATPMEDRLVYDSPVPLNEEQRKIIAALNKSDCRFIAVEGPPGTGKSHTITACVFDAILREKNVLILSDKKEALNVAEDKIRQTLAKVRLDENIQDPILRLGKQGSSYTKILSTKTIDQLKRSLQVAKDSEEELEQNIKDQEDSLKSSILRQEKTETAIDLKKVISLQREEKAFDYINDDTEMLFQNKTFRRGIKAAQDTAEFIGSDLGRRLISITGGDYSKAGLERFFSDFIRVGKAIDSLDILADFAGYGDLTPTSISRLAEIADKIEGARKPIIGYMFSKSSLRQASQALKDEFDYRDADKVPSILPSLRRTENSARALVRALADVHVTSSAMQNAAFLTVLKGNAPSESYAKQLRDFAAIMFDAMDQDEDGHFAAIGLTEDDLSPLVGDTRIEVLTRLKDVSEHAAAVDTVSESFRKVPVFEYAAELDQLEHYQTQKLANTLDERVVEFANTKKNKAQQIKDIIKQKQMFPKDLFHELRNAFPVMIAGIRDYAEYVPLEKGLFDLIIIDEASQVSIAQALPAFVRAKKVLVLGDKAQFSNVKTERASIAVNQTYKAQVLEQFREEKDPDIAQLNQIKMFDIKTSVLEFVERIANLRIMLRKHFRGYPELIGFSSKYFYKNQLQAVKIRGIPIDDVIRFHEIEHDGLVGLRAKTNEPEATVIVEELMKLADSDHPPDCCVITPHNEQQKLILQKVMAFPGGREMMEKLHLRVFTFDTCQGEERHTIFYSMVANPGADRLNYIFPKDLEKHDDVEDNLRLQRLNVGFSRAKERIVIFHSKPIEQFKGSIGLALRHYADVLDRSQEGPTTADVDPSSPMERKVVGWLQQAPVLEELGDQVEVDAQFELGQYLRQLDPSYDHPNYKVDFLIKVRGETKKIQIIVEYDGFKEHFTDLDEVDAENYQDYMRSADVERQKILEGYGYKFLRINRFNIGDNPILTLDERLRRLIRAIDIEKQPPKLIEEYQDKQAALESGDSRVCKKCARVLPKKDFFDRRLKNGKGGYGRICMECKGQPKGQRRTSSQRGRHVPVSVKDRTYLRCPYSEREECKRLGGRWDPFNKKWYIPKHVDALPFSRWL